MGPCLRRGCHSQAVGKAVKLKPDEKKFLLSPKLLWSLASIRTYPVHQMPGTREGHACR